MERPGQEPDPGFDLLAKVLFPFIFLGIFVVSVVLIPSARFTIASWYVELRLKEAQIFSDQELYRLRALKEELHALGPERLTPRLAGRAIRLATTFSERAAFRASLVLSGVLFLGSALLILWFRSKTKMTSAETAIAQYRKASLDEILAQYGISKIPEGPVEAARFFQELRRKKNIPPNVIARKIKDPVLAGAIWWWPRVCEKETPEVLWPVSERKELAEFLARTVAHASGETDEERITQLKKKVEAALQSMNGGGFQ